jgi:probable F420-dependent oxidoreductase
MTDQTTGQLGRYGAFQRLDSATPALAAGLEGAGYGALWVGGSPGGDLAEVEALLAATSRLVVATGIVNVWKDDAASIAVAARRILDRYPGRFLLGIGVGHPEASRAVYARPYTALVEYLDELDRAGVEPRDRVLAALGPRVLGLAAERTAGAHPYLVPPEHTRQARALLGDGVLLAPEHKVVLDGDRVRGRVLARPAVARPYLSLVNYVSNLRRLGYSDDDLAGEGSDRLIDDLVAIGEPDEVARRLRAHLDAGADHVAVHLIAAPGADLLDGYRRLAAAL